MAGSDDKTNKIKQSKELTEAFLMLNTEERISEQALSLYRIYENEENKTADRINAIKLIWEYALSKPKQGLEIGADKDTLTGVKIEIVNPKQEENGTEPKTD